MAKDGYIGDTSNKARKVKKGYIGDENNKARKIKKGYIGDINGKARLVWSSGLGKIVAGFNNQTFGKANSYNGLTLLTMPSTIVVKGTPKIAFGNERFVTVITKETSSIISGEKTGAYSFDGETWYPSNINVVGSNPDYYVKFLGFINNYFVELDSAGVLRYSSDGENWGDWEVRSSESILDTVVFASDGYYYVSGDMFPSVFKFQTFGGAITYLSNSNGNVCGATTNSDGSIMVGYSRNNGFYKFNFTTNTYELKSNILTSNTAMRCSTYGNGRFVMIHPNSNYSTFYSLDGETWSNVPSPRIIYSISFDGSNFLAGSDQGIYMYSADAITWNIVYTTGMTNSISYAISGN